MTILAIITAFLMALAAMLYWILRGTRTSETEAPEELLDGSCEARYRPMFRLLDESDYEVVAAGLRGKMSLWRFRVERRALFRAYLRELGADHARIVGAIRNLLVQSDLDRPELAKALYTCRFRFEAAMLSVEWNLLRHVVGIGTVDVRAMVGAVDKLHTQFEDMLFVRAVTAGANA